jgi:hypothetical protein
MVERNGDRADMVVTDTKAYGCVQHEHMEIKVETSR